MLWPSLLGMSKYEFAKTYCEAKMVQGAQGKVFQFGAMVFLCKINSLEELNVLLTQTVMVCYVSLLDFFSTIIQELRFYLVTWLKIDPDFFVKSNHRSGPIKSPRLNREIDINMARLSAMKEGDTSSMENRQETEPMANNCSSEDDDDVSGIPKSVSESDVVSRRPDESPPVQRGLSQFIMIKVMSPVELLRKPLVHCSCLLTLFFLQAIMSKDNEEVSAEGASSLSVPDEDPSNQYLY
ncbi:hypothetical protein IFM89_022255 [Coptis chinensis]|uniref:Uncharacterized protein n=1 Tax=Coptis chinensis TaxID=261450 RepID=A0A835LNH5_9MAGN|nr:hypothetical protein IFM89_022255 [Coptis chinensis]